MLSSVRCLTAAQRLLPASRSGVFTRNNSWSTILSPLVRTRTDEKQEPQAKVFVPQTPKKKTKLEPPPGIPLTEPFPGLPSNKYGGVSGPPAPITQITTLASGLKVASEDNYGQVAVIGLFVNVGTRNETPENRGITQWAERVMLLANRSLVQDAEAIGANMSASSSRELLVLSVEVPRHYIKEGVQLLAKAILQPEFNEQQLTLNKQFIISEIDKNSMNPQLFLPEVLHQVAFNPESGLDKSAFVEPESIEKLTEAQLHQFIKTYFVASNMVLSAAGVEHAELCNIVQDSFASVSSAPAPQFAPKAQYRPGQAFVPFTPQTKGQQKGVGGGGPGGDEPLTHIGLAFQGLDYADPDLFAAHVLYTLLGGGGAFSAGGPGKGMYSRLYQNLLMQYSWIETIMAFTSSYRDTGLFGIYGAGTPKYAQTLVELMCSSLAEVSKNVGEEELVRSRNQLKSGVLMNLEARGILFDDIGRQVILYGKRYSAAECCSLIDSVTSQHVQAVAKRFLLERPCLVAAGPESELRRVPSLDWVERYIKKVM